MNHGPQDHETFCLELANCRRVLLGCEGVESPLRQAAHVAHPSHTHTCNSWVITCSRFEMPDRLILRRTVLGTVVSFTIFGRRPMPRPS